MVEVEKLANFIRESNGQFFRIATGRDRLTDTHYSLIAMAARFTDDDGYCGVHALSDTPTRYGLRASVLQRLMIQFR